MAWEIDSFSSGSNTRGGILISAEIGCTFIGSISSFLGIKELSGDIACKFFKLESIALSSCCKDAIFSSFCIITFPSNFTGIPNFVTGLFSCFKMLILSSVLFLAFVRPLISDKTCIGFNAEDGASGLSPITTVSGIIGITP